MADLKPGTVFAGCRIESVRGRGGMGVVYLARELSLDRPVAIKLINDQQADTASAHRRLEREARLMASIDHPNVIPVYAAGEEEGHLYLVMRYVAGTDLQALLAAQGRLSSTQAARITDQVGRALDAAHQHGLVHRDIKPSNVLLSGDHAYLTDFGISRLIDERTNSTDVGKLIGTFDYMSPEQLRGEAAGPRSDVYSLGCLLYACLAGSPPFKRESAAATITAHLHEGPTKVSGVPGVSKDFDQVIRRALAKRPRDRYGSAAQLGTAALAAAQGRRGRGLGGALRPRTQAASPSIAPVPLRAPGVGRDEASGATAAATGVETKPARTAVMPPPAMPAADRPEPEVEEHRRRSGARPIAVALACALLVAVVAAMIALSGDGARPAGPLTKAEILHAVRAFAADYSSRDLHALSGLLAADVTRVDLSSTQHGMAAVLRNYSQQFTTSPVPTGYSLSHISTTPGWAGRAAAEYTLTLTGGGTLSGRVVFGLQRSDGRVQLALISTG